MKTCPPKWMCLILLSLLASSTQARRIGNEDADYLNGEENDLEKFTPPISHDDDKSYAHKLTEHVTLQDLLERLAAGNELHQAQKRRFDSIQHFSDFGGFGKRSFDPIQHISSFGGFGKRNYDPSQDRIAKRPFDSIQHRSSFGSRNGFVKKSFDSIGHDSLFGGFGKRAFDSIDHFSDFGGMGKRSFDRIGHISAFGGFGKRGEGQDQRDKRRFDSIGFHSSFGGFGKDKRDAQEDSDLDEAIRNYLHGK